LLLALSVIKELLKFLRETRKCDPAEQRSTLIGVKTQIVRQTIEGKEKLEIIV